MADSSIEKAAPAPDVSSAEHSQEEVVRPTGWKYKEIRLGGRFYIPYYASPIVQLLVVSLVCFMCPGMYNALSGMGGGGQVDRTAANDANTALYSTFAVVSFFAGTFTNVLGIKTALAFGGIGYSIYIASFLSYNHNQNYGFVVFSGAFLGICAGLLWCAQGAIMMSYPPEKSKGRYISWFWMIFNLGGVIGSLIPLGQNIHTTTNSAVNDGTYIGFLVLTLIGAGLATCLVHTRNVVRYDGSRIIMMKNPSWKTEILGLWQTFLSDPYIVALFPMFFASNWFYTYHFNDVNLAQFNTRTRALNGVLYWSSQIVGALVFGIALDRVPVRRRLRAQGCWVALFVLTFVIWGGGYDFQKDYTRDEVNAGLDTPDDTSDDYEKMDWTSSGYVGPMFLYIFYGFYDAAWQTSVYWYMGTLTNNGRKLANFAGFYKGIQSAGGAIMWRLDNLGIPFMNLFASCWALLAGSLVVGLPVILWKVKDTVSLEEDLKFSDETAEEVLGRKRREEEEDKEAKV
ncbi:major facilitator superfamily domain-containing protein [Lineolata rhizophorae]|uniref:Major facilitator superfamily domain-containing protein n=1 Tax=Lineolata rhizophorae TaxID=578093 RepID=A0A6A6NPD1_9PEZI|nr:major facilitator superfamily domain-containing protein [Lineolata rhizophorae]